MSVTVPVSGLTQPPDFQYLTTTNRTTLFSVAAGEKSCTLVSIGAVNNDASATVLTIEHYDGTTYSIVWRKSIAANDMADMVNFPVGLVVKPGSSIVVTAASANRITVTANRTMQS